MTLLDSIRTDLGLYFGKDEFVVELRGRRLEERVKTRLGLFPGTDDD